MKISEIKDIATERGIRAGKLKKSELVRAIQRAENNNDCFETGVASTCGQSACLWRSDCN